MALRRFTAIETGVIRDLQQCGQTLGYEFLAVLEGDGEAVIDFRTDRKNLRCGIGLAAVAETERGREVVIRRTHGATASLSWEDWVLMARRPAIVELSLHQTDGTGYRGRVVPGREAMVQALALRGQTLYTKAWEAIDRAVVENGESVATDFAMHAVNEALAGHEAVVYALAAAGPTAADLKSHGTAITKAVDIVHEVIARMLKTG